jgi:hypothetical protein
VRSREICAAIEGLEDEEIVYRLCSIFLESEDPDVRGQALGKLMETVDRALAEAPVMRLIAREPAGPLLAAAVEYLSIH